MTRRRHVALLQDEQTGFQNSFMKLERWREDTHARTNFEQINKCTILPMQHNHPPLVKPTGRPGHTVPGRSSTCALRFASLCRSRSCPCRSGRTPSSGPRRPERRCPLQRHRSVKSVRTLISVQGVILCFNATHHPQPLCLRAQCPNLEACQRKQHK